MRIAVTAVLLAASAVVMGVTATAFGMVDNGGDDRVFIACTVALWILFAAAIIVFRGVRGRAAVALILACLLYTSPSPRDSMENLVLRLRL